jgi:hypothetical protein
LKSAEIGFWLEMVVAHDDVSGLGLKCDTVVVFFAVLA